MKVNRSKIEAIDVKRMEEISNAGNFEWQVWLAAKEYAAAGLYVLPIEKNKKSLPYSGISYSSASRKAKIIDKWFHPDGGKFAGYNVGIATGKEDGVFVVDVDRHGSEDGFISLNAFIEEYGELPAGPQQKTPNGGKHYLFQWQENASSSTGKIAKSIDTRGGTKDSCKGHIVVFPSKINGVRYEWDTGGTVPYIPPWVMQKMGLSWSSPRGSGRGNENVESEDMEKPVSKDQVLRMLGAIDPNDVEYEEWLKIGLSIKSQFPEKEGLEMWDEWSSKGDRYKENECRTRWHGFSESGTVRIGTLFYYAKESGWTPEREDVIANKWDVLVEQMNKTYAVVVTGGKIKILREQAEVHDSVLGHYDLMGKDDFRVLLQNDTIMVQDQRGKEKMMSVADIWLGHGNRRTYQNGMGLFPDGKSPNGWYNTWNGFSVEPREGKCELFIDHIKKVVCNGQEELSEWLLDWCADAVQDPSNPKGTAVVMRGDEGTGKGTLANVMGELFGSHFRHLIDDSHLLSNFNSHMMDALFVFADEITWGGNKKTSGKLKGMITEKYLVGERKGVDAVGYRNMIHVMIASNGEWIVPAGHNSRRWFVIDVPNRRASEESYFNAMHQELDNGGREALLYYLLNREITNNLRVAPVTDTLKEQRIRSSADDSVLQWWVSNIEKAKILTPEYGDEPGNKKSDWPDMVLKVGLYEDYESWCIERRSKPETSTIFYKKMVNYGLSSKRVGGRNNRVYVYSIPSHNEATKKLEFLTGIKIN